MQIPVDTDVVYCTAGHTKRFDRQGNVFQFSIFVLFAQQWYFDCGVLPVRSPEKIQ